MNNMLLTKSLKYLKDIKKKKVFVIGDILLDKYTYGKVSSISTGIKLPIIEKNKTIYNWLYNKCWGDTTTVSLPTLFFCKKISI